MEEKQEEKGRKVVKGRSGEGMLRVKTTIFLITIKGKRTSHHLFIVAHYILKVAMSAHSNSYLDPLVPPSHTCHKVTAYQLQEEKEEHGCVCMNLLKRLSTHGQRELRTLLQ